MFQVWFPLTEHFTCKKMSKFNFDTLAQNYNFGIYSKGKVSREKYDPNNGPRTGFTSIKELQLLKLSSSIYKSCLLIGGI